MKHIIEALVLEGYRIRLRFADGATGEIDFSSEPMTGVFEIWKDTPVFHQMKIGEHGRTLLWPGNIDLRADSLWVQATVAVGAISRNLPTACA